MSRARRVAAAADRHDVVSVLTRAGRERDAFCAAIGGAGADLDPLLVSAVLRSRRRVGATLATRRALVELCGLLRAIDAAEVGMIEPAELATGLELHAARTDAFAEFDEARVLLRTLGEVLSHAGAAGSSRAIRSQLELLHAELRSWLLAQLTGDASGDVAAELVQERPDPRHAWRVQDPARRAQLHAIVDKLQHGADRHPVRGLLGSAWLRGWSAVPVAGEMLGDDPAELERLAAALERLAPGHRLVQVDLQPAAPWRLEGLDLVVQDGLRASWELPPGRVGLELAAIERRGWTVVTTEGLQFAYVERAGHHAVLGPREFVEAVCGAPPLEAIAAFRQQVEALATDGEPPADLLAVAMEFGRLRRRSR